MTEGGICMKLILFTFALILGSVGAGAWKLFCDNIQDDAFDAELTLACETEDRPGQELSMQTAAQTA
jgi:hypothetical protein